MYIPKPREVNNHACPQNRLPGGLGGGGEDFAWERLAVDEDGLPEALHTHLALELREVDAAKVVEVNWVAFL